MSVEATVRGAGWGSNSTLDDVVEAIKSTFTGMKSIEKPPIRERKRSPRSIISGQGGDEGRQRFRKANHDTNHDYCGKGIPGLIGLQCENDRVQRQRKMIAIDGVLESLCLKSTGAGEVMSYRLSLYNSPSPQLNFLFVHNIDQFVPSLYGYHKNAFDCIIAHLQAGTMVARAGARRKSRISSRVSVPRSSSQ